MNNRDFWNSVNKNNEHRNCNGDELVCDMMVKEGLGQTKGGYFDVAKYPKYNIVQGSYDNVDLKALNLKSLDRGVIITKIESK